MFSLKPARRPSYGIGLGSAWPPSSDSENLYVVDGTSPGSVGMSVAQIEGEYLVSANVNQPVVTFKKKAASEANPACVVTGLEMDDEDQREDTLLDRIESVRSEAGASIIVMDENYTTSAATEIGLDHALSPVKDASGWAQCARRRERIYCALLWWDDSSSSTHLKGRGWQVR